MSTLAASPPRTFGWRTVALAVGFAVLAVLAWSVATYNRLVALDQQVQAQWAQVENVYQRRLDLVPNLVRTVQGAAAFERGTLLAVTEARTRAQSVAASTGGGVPGDPAAFARSQAAQNELSSALGRLMVVVERYPDLHATENFRDLQAQLEGTENRIAVERMRFNEAARDFNARRASFPTMLVAGAFAGRFHARPYFTAAPEARSALVVQF